MWLFGVGICEAQVALDKVVDFVASILTFDFFGSGYVVVFVDWSPPVEVWVFFRFVESGVGLDDRLVASCRRAARGRGNYRHWVGLRSGVL